MLLSCINVSLSPKAMKKCPQVRILKKSISFNTRTLTQAKGPLLSVSSVSKEKTTILQPFCSIPVSIKNLCLDSRSFFHVLACVF